MKCVPKSLSVVRPSRIAPLVACFSLIGGVLAACGSSSGDAADVEDAIVPTETTDGGSTRSDGGSVPEGGGDDPEGGIPIDTRYVDDCQMEKAACTAMPAGYAEGKGLAPLDRCAFALTESAGLGGAVPLVDALAAIAPRVTLDDVMNDTNRRATVTSSVPGNPAAVATAFRWDDVDYASPRWIPQGVTGSADADPSGVIGGRRIVLVSFYDADETDANKGVRIAFVDTSKTPPEYRLVLLVTPSGTPEAPSFVPVKLHAGGLTWFGRYLYVAETTRGFRVFDMESLLKVDTTVDSIGCQNGLCCAGTYKYVLPEVGRYRMSSVTTACEPRFSFVSLDRSTAPPSLLSGEYCASTACSSPLSGRVFRWPLEANTGRLRSVKTFPTEAFYMGQRQVQGAASMNDTYFFSSSAPAGKGGALYRVKGKKSATSKWSDGPEDLMIDRGRGLLFSASEQIDARVVFGVQLTGYPAP